LSIGEIQVSKKATSDSESSPLRGDPDDERADHPGSKDSGQRIVGSPSAEAGEGLSAQPARAARGQAEAVIHRLHEVLPHFGFTVEDGRSPVTGLLRRFSADDLVDAVKWGGSDYYTGSVYVSQNAVSRAAVLMSQLGRLTQQWIEFRDEHDVQTYAEFLALPEDEDDAAGSEEVDLADASHVEEVNEAERAERASQAAEAERLAQERAAKLAAEEAERTRQLEEAEQAEAERKRAQDELVAERAARPHWFVDHDERTYRRAVGRGRPRRGEVEFVGEEAELLARWPSYPTS
jgi:hypothetical protein